ncbi:hypothetical protein EDB85DRAFT_2147778 [Lactarius pseudohatsudake]|nr:hypothetical protein EDB85DRAFT_2147778 [Lactarius pseudohatsudake]
MSQTPFTSTSNFRALFVSALTEYEKKTKTDLHTHPLSTQLQSCQSSSDIIAVLHDKVNEFDQSRSHNERLSSWLAPTINVLYAFSATLGEGIFSPAKVISAGVGVLLLAAKDVNASQEVLAGLFEGIENFFKRLESYTEVPPTDAMTDIIVKIMVEVLNIFAIATKEMKQGRAKKFFKKLVGRQDIEDALARLDILTQEEARMAAAQILRLTRSVNVKVKVVDDKVTVVGNQMKNVDKKMDIVLNDGIDAKAVLQQTSKSVNDVKWNQLRDNLRRWVTPPDPSTNHNIACDIHHGGTAEWFYQGSTFAEWKSIGSLLWIYGKPGSGKSILCSTIIQDIASLRKAGSALMVYFYFDFRDLDKQHRRNLLPSLLIQLSAQSRPCCDILSHLYSAHDNGEQKPSDSVMIRCLKDMLTILNPQPVYIILDALDECPNWPGIPSPREQVLALVKELVGPHLPHLHICVTSRPEFDIRATLTPLAHHRVSLHDESGQKKDIVDYLNSVVYSDSETMMKRWREDDKKMVVEALSEKADGMFRWVFCQLDTLRHCLPSGVRQTLEELPESLDETYERIVMDIKKTNSAHAYRMLQCLAVAIRPLSVAELAELLAFDFNATKGGIPELNPNWRWEDHEQAVLSTCSSLITIVPAYGSHSPVVQFSHFSVKEFLMSDRLSTPTKNLSRFHIVPEDANTLIARACLSVLLRDPVGEDNTATAPLARYAAEYWVTHAQVENVASRIRNGMEYLFDPDRPYFSAWVKLYRVVHSNWKYDLRRIMLPSATPLYYAALCGFHEIVERLALKYPQYTNAISGRTGTALHSASVEGQVEVVRSLLKYGADVDARGVVGQSPLQLASHRGHLNVVRCLLDHGADAEFRSDVRMTPLAYAASLGTLEIVRVLLEHNVDVNSQDKAGLTPIHRLLLEGGFSTSRSDHPQIVRLLLEHGADPNIRDNRHRTALHLVPSWGLMSSWDLVLSLRVEIARILLAHGADVNAGDAGGRTPLQVASTEGQDEIVQLLLDYCSEWAQL